MRNLTARAGSQERRGREGCCSCHSGAPGRGLIAARGHAQLDHHSAALHPRISKSASEEEPRRPLQQGRRNIWTRREKTTTTRNMQSHQLHGSEPVRASGGKKQKRSADPSGREEPDDGGSDDDEPPRRSRNTKAAQTSTIRGLLRDFFEQQLRLDAQRQEMMARQAQERMFFEEQWRQSMRRIEQERLMLEQAWVEREEQRRMREEDRAARRDALLTSLLTRLLQGDL